MSDTCGRCGRRLKNPAYIEIGFGRTCAAKMGIALPSKRKPKDKPDRQDHDQEPAPAAEGR
ncbi:DUF6011 domain-containing protein [Oscillibacter sp.]|uniref:DUF6011 domain-containing protein n=1 Tax=Oscillibacter sp. TaxID=1945593 RepID=UPI0026070578|nr:DUF6011 domain-containing protein [Oscillibacter sp.]MDD3347515.1 DUF6011 domain-containing protein [Oscillibacter sp.]